MRLLALALLCLLGSACVSSGPVYRSHDGLLWHPKLGLAVPDLALEGWERVTIEESDLAFRRAGADVIAMRVRCRTDEGPPLIWESRDLWIGIPQTGSARREFELQGHEAIETVAESDGVRVRTVVVRADAACRLHVAHVASARDEPTDPVDGFLARVRFP